MERMGVKEVRMVAVLRLCLMIGFAMTLAACSFFSFFSRYERVALEPVAVGTRDRLDEKHEGGPWCSFKRGTGTAIPAPESGQVLLGYDGFNDPGTPPFACPEHAIHYFSGAVRFDVTTVPAEANNRLLVATMTAQRHLTPQPNNPACERSFGRIGSATARWNPGFASGRFESDNAPYMFCQPGDDPNTLTCNVGNVVREWVSGERSNLGVVLLAPVLGNLEPSSGVGILGSSPLRCAHYYGNFRLEVYFVRNPS
jgi:hypothetical protein